MYTENKTVTPSIPKLQHSFYNIFRNLVTVLTGYVSQISACKVHREPSRDRYTINIVSLLPLWEISGYASTIFHLHTWKADTSFILRQTNIAQQGWVGKTYMRYKLICKPTGIWKKAREAALSNDRWGLAWNNETIVSVRLEEGLELHWS